MALAGFGALCACSLLAGLDGFSEGAGSNGTGMNDAAANGDVASAGADATDEGAGGDENGDVIMGDAGRADGRTFFDAVTETATDAGGASDTGAESDTDGAADVDGSNAPEGSSAVDGSGASDSVADADGSNVPEGSSTADGPGAGDSAADADAGDLTAGLIAYYPFDETSGTSAADASGNGHTASLYGGASWAAGHKGGAVQLDGSSGYVALPAGIVSSTSDFTIATWVMLNSSQAWARIFDFGTGTNKYMFLTGNSGASSNATRFSITNNGYAGEQRINALTLATASWQHIAVTVSGGVGTIYINGTSAAANGSMTLDAASLGSTTQNWLGRSEYSSDPYTSGLFDEFRIYSRALSATEIQTLAN